MRPLSNDTCPSRTLPRYPWAILLSDFSPCAKPARSTTPDKRHFCKAALNLGSLAASSTAFFSVLAEYMPNVDTDVLSSRTMSMGAVLDYTFVTSYTPHIHNFVTNFVNG
eukprot:m.48355 g.48355  ORF g.48355 m.48355 type:complete len:110 (-) comp10565_c0_seq1:639-968(-)